MRLRHSLLLFALLLGGSVSLASAEPLTFTEARREGGELKYINELPVLFVQGTPEQMGRQVAALTSRQVRPLLRFPREILNRNGLGYAWPIIAAVAGEMIKNVPPEHRREVESAIAASGLDRDVLLVANCLLELRRFGGCSTLYVDAQRSATGGPLLGRNLDLPPLGVLDKYSIVAIVRPKGKLAFAAVGYPGLAGVVSGMNEKGLAVATLDVYSSKDRSPMFDPKGVPLTFCYRRLLEECGTVDEAVKLMRNMKATTWMNLAVCDRRGGAVLEITPQNVVVRKPADGVLPCTNHFRSPELATFTACRRYDLLRRSRSRGAFTLRDLAGYMHSVNQGGMTVQSMIFEPATLKLHLAIGLGPQPASSRPMRELKLRPLFERE